MDKFFKKLTGDDKTNNKKKTSTKPSSSSNNNPLSSFKNPFDNKPKPNYGGGTTLGGTQPGITLPITLTQPGSLGVRVEKTAKGGSIVATVIPDGQAAAAGLRRGDVFCFAGSNGAEELPYDLFLELARSEQRPLSLEVRRIETTGEGGRVTRSADDEARKQAVIAAAEKRDRDFKKKGPKNNNNNNKKDNLPVILSSKELRKRDEERAALAAKPSEQPLSEEARRAVMQAKESEQQDARNLGYNPYETARMTAGQAKVATTNVIHGDIKNNDETKATPSSAPPTTTTRRSSPAPAPPTSSSPSPTLIPVSESFETTLASLLSATSPPLARQSLSIVHKLVTNAYTKTDDKFKRVRLSNPKIAASVVEVHGGVDLMMLFGFVIYEEGGETFLVFGEGSGGKPEWWREGLRRVEVESRER